MHYLKLRWDRRAQELLWRAYVAYSCLRLQLESRHDLDGEDFSHDALLPQLPSHE